MKKLWEKIKALVSKEFRLLKKFAEHGKVAYEFVQALKSAVENPVADWIVNITKTDLDNALLAKARVGINEILTRMAIAQGIIQQATSNSDVAAAIIAELKKRFPDGRKGFWVELAGEINVYLADGEISFAEGVSLSQKIFLSRKK